MAAPGANPYEYQKETPPGGQEPKRNEPEVIRIVIGEQAAKTDGTATAIVPETAPGTTKPEIKPEAAMKPAVKAETAPVVKPQPKPAPKPNVKPAVKSSGKPAARSEYWIQTASYKNQNAAEELSRRLAEKGLAGRVFSSDQKSETWYRVRIGPYADRQEADKFLGLVKKIQGLEASYISQVTAPGA
jgi:cell division protein FtsN